MLAIVRAPDVRAAWTVGTVAGGLVLPAAFVAIEKRAAAPLVRLCILRSRPQVRANAGAALLVGGFVGFPFVAVLYLQEVRGWSQIETGLALLVVGIDIVLAPGTHTAAGGAVRQQPGRRRWARSGGGRVRPVPSRRPRLALRSVRRSASP